MGNPTVPNKIAGLRYTGHDVKICSYTEGQISDANSGFSNIDIQAELVLLPDTEDSPEEITVIARMVVDGFYGTQSDYREGDAPAFSLDLRVEMRYECEGCKGTRVDFSEHQWFFDAQATLLLFSIAGDITKDTPYRVRNYSFAI